MIIIKPHFWSNFVPFGASSSPKNIFFPKIWLGQSLDIKKTNAPILKKPSDGRTDGQTSESNFTGCCPTNNAGDTNKMQLTRLRITY